MKTTMFIVVTRDFIFENDVILKKLVQELIKTNEQVQVSRFTITLP